MRNKIFSDWISQYLDYARNTESPTNYHIWTAIGMIGAAMRRQCYMQWGHEKIFPNMYIVLVGPSGKARKGSALGLGQDIYNAIDLSTTPDSLSTERLIHNIKNTKVSFLNPETKEETYQCATITFSKELVNYLREQDVKFLGVLTDWYDSAELWRYETFTRGADYIEGICYSLLGATAPDWIMSILPQAAIGGGFTSRVIFVVEKDKAKSIALPKQTQESHDVRAALINDLAAISEKIGRFYFNKEAEQAYAAWYEEQEKDASDDRFPVADERFRGYCERRATHIKKVCMAICASSSDLDNFEINLSDFNRAQQFLERIEPNMPLVFGGSTVSDQGRVAMNVLQFIRRNGKSSRREILSHFYAEFGSTAVFDQVTKLLEDTGAITVSKVLGQETYYEAAR